MKKPLQFKRSEARTKISDIIRKASGGQIIQIINTRGKAVSSFVPLSSIAETKDRLVKETDADELRRTWTAKREEVENTGVTYRILVNGKPKAALVATDFSIRTKVARTRANLGKTEIIRLEDHEQALRQFQEQIETLQNQIENLSSVLGTLTGEGGVPSLVKLVETLLREWRLNKNLSAVPIAH